MSKYTDEFKIKVVKYCLEGRHSCEDAKKFFNIPSEETIRRWCKHYFLYKI